MCPSLLATNSDTLFNTVILQCSSLYVFLRCRLGATKTMRSLMILQIIARVWFLHMIGLSWLTSLLVGLVRTFHPKDEIDHSPTAQLGIFINLKKKPSGTKFVTNYLSDWVPIITIVMCPSLQAPNSDFLFNTVTLQTSYLYVSLHCMLGATKTMRSLMIL